MIDVLFEDNHIIVAKKEAGILSQADNTEDKDMLSMLKDYIKIKYNKSGNVFLGLVHRLDRPVGGVMVFARTSKGASRLSEQIRTRSFDKTYLAIIHNTLSNKKGTLKDFLYKDTKKNIVSVVNKNHKESKEAVLDYEILELRDNLSLVKIHLKTGRPHQIRVQFASRNCPLYSDHRYGKSEKGDIALWSYEIGFNHPTLKEYIKFNCIPPNEYPWNLFDLDKIQ